MKKHTHFIKRTLTTFVISILATIPVAMAALYDKQDNQKNILEPLKGETERFPSFLDSIELAGLNKTKSNFEEVLGLINQNKIKEAEARVSALLKESPNETAYYNLQALLDTLNKDTTSAVKNYEKAIKLDPKNYLAYLGLSKLALDGGQLDKAKEYADRAVAINEKAVNGYLFLADVAFKQNNYAEIEKVLLTAQEKIKGKFADEAKVIQGLAKFYALKKQPEKILAISEDLVKRYPDNTLALTSLAGAQVVNNKKSEAEKTLRQIINQDKQDTNNRLLLAKLLAEHQNTEKEVISLIDEAIKISPDKPEPQVFKAAYLIKLKRIQEALELADKIDKQFPKLILGKILRGDVYLAEKKLDKATDMYQQAYNIQPNEQVLFTLVDLLSAQGKTSDTINLLNNALDKNPKSGAIHFKLANVYQQQNDNAQAEVHYNAILDQQPDNVLALNNLAILYSQQNSPKKALEFAKKAYDRAPESASILDTYGYILIKQGHSKDGLPILEKAASLAPKVSDIQFHLAEAYSANNNNQKAIDILEKIVKTENNFSEKKSAENLLNKLKSR